MLECNAFVDASGLPDQKITRGFGAGPQLKVSDVAGVHTLKHLNVIAYLEPSSKSQGLPAGFIRGLAGAPSACFPSGYMLLFLRPVAASAVMLSLHVFFHALGDGRCDLQVLNGKFLFFHAEAPG